MLELNECSAAYGAWPALSRVTLRAGAGQIASIVGPSGCGKSTLLMLAAGLKRPSAGTVRLDGKAVAPGDRRIGLILQQYGLFPWFTVRENVELGLKIRRVQAEQRRRRAAREISDVGLKGLEHRFPRQLSGGQQQRVAIARAFALEPRLLLMDEPFSALDALSREQLQDDLLGAVRGRETAILVVTHGIEEAVYLGQVIWVLAGSPGKIVGRLANPRQGSAGYRQKREFLALCGEVRSLLARERAT
jgi:NitT/TauT family transport system ATP-binding protein